MVTRKPPQRINRQNRIVGLMVLIIIIPIAFFSIYELSNLRKNEEIIQKIYQSQLEAILNSVNQYIDGIFNNWANEMQNNNASNISDQNKAIYSSFITNQQGAVIHSNHQDSLFGSIFEITDKNEIKTLQQYFKNDYRKMETQHYKQWVVIYFVTQNSLNKSVIGGFVIEPEIFFSNNLSPYMQSTTEDKFDIFIFPKNNTTTPVYRTSRTNVPEQSLVTQNFWHFNQYQLGIALKNKTIEELTSDRKRLNLWSIILLDVLIIIVAIVIYINIKREIELTNLKSDFVANVSHEIRTPLSLISMYIETLEMGRVKSENKRAEYYQVISHETKRLSELVNRILNFSKIENNRKVYSFEEVEFHDFVTTLIENHKYHLANKGFKWNLVKETESNIIVEIDKEAISDALINIIDNAVKYSADNKQIDITTGKTHKYAYVKIRDYGIGVSFKNIKRIFDKFYRVSEGKELAYKVRGAGLGLSIVKKIIDEHQGKIEIESTVGEGSAFMINLPLKNI